MEIWTYAEWLRRGELDFKILDVGMIEMGSFDYRSHRKYFAESLDLFIWSNFHLIFL